MLSGVIILAIYLVALAYVGFFIASVLFYFVMHRTLSNSVSSVRSIASAAALSIVVSSALYALFHEVLLVPLPTDSLFG